MESWKFTISTANEDVESDMTYSGSVTCRPISIEEKFDLMIKQTMALNEKNELVPIAVNNPLAQMKVAVSTVNKYLTEIDLARTSDGAKLTDLHQLNYIAGNDHIYSAIFAALIKGPKLGNA